MNPYFCFFKGLGFVIYEARRHGIKLILSLVNNYENLGGKNLYVKWARDEGHNITSDDDFFTNSVVKGFYKNHIKVIDLDYPSSFLHFASFYLFLPLEWCDLFAQISVMKMEAH